MKKIKLKTVEAQIGLWKDQGYDKAALKSAYDALVKDCQVVDDTGAVVDFTLQIEETDPNSELVTKMTTMEAELKKFRDQLSNLNTIPDRISKGLQITGGTARNDDEGKWGYKHLGEYYQDVAKACRPGSGTPERLRKSLETKASLTAYGAEVPGSEGGFAVPPDFRPQIIMDADEEPNIFALTDQIRTSTNNLTIPTSQDPAWDNSNGVRVYWTGEAQAVTQSKPILTQTNMVLNKLACLVPVTDELLSDSTAIASYVPQKAGMKMRYEIDRTLMRGTGGAQPLGILNAGSLVTVAKESSQSAAGIVIDNVTKMLGSLYAPSIRKAVWLIHPTVLPALMTMTIGQQAAWGPINNIGYTNFAYPPAGMLLGCPVYLSQTCSVLGTVGDIVLADWSQYLTLLKQDTATQAISVDLWFDQDVTAFRYTFRIAGRPWRSEAITQASGSDKLGYFVTLAARP